MRVHEDIVIRQDGSSGIDGIVEKPDFFVIAAVDAEYLPRAAISLPSSSSLLAAAPTFMGQSPHADPITIARAELREETGFDGDEMISAGHLFLAYGYSKQRYHVFMAKGLRQGKTSLEQEKQDLVAQFFDIAIVDDMIRNGLIKNATTVADLGLLKLKGMI